MKLRSGLIALFVTAGVDCALAADWPGYLGPRRDGTSPEKGLLRAWPKEGPKVLWTAAVGSGYGGPAVADGKFYLLDRDDAVGDTLRCLDLATGKELWNFAYPAPGRFDHTGSRTTPAVDGDKVYTFGPLGDLYAISTATHKPVWQKNVWKDIGGGQLPRWALTQNPLIYRDLVIVGSQVQEHPSRGPAGDIRAFDARSGRPVGEAFAVRHLHGRLSFEHGGWSAAAGRIAIPLVERTGSLWLMSRSGATTEGRPLP